MREEEVISECDLCYPSVQSWPGTRCQGTEVFQLQIEVIILIVVLSNCSMIRKYTEENHGGGDEENNHQPTVQVDHCTAADLGLTGEMARLSPRQSEMERDRQGGDREMSR